MLLDSLENLRLRYVLSMFLFFWKSEPQRSYKHGSYKKKGVRRNERTKERRNERRNKATFDITIILVYQRLPDIYNPTTLSPK